MPFRSFSSERPLQLSRRRFLRGGAGVALALPLFEPALARAAPPKRLIFFATVLGSYPEEFWPRKPGQAPLPRGYQPAKMYFTGNDPMDTRDFELAPIGMPLAAHKSDLLYVEGLDPGNVNGHGGYCNLLTGAREINLDGDNNVTGGGISFDQFIANRIGADSRFPSLQVGVRPGGGKYGTLSFFGPRKEAPAEGNPRVLFDRVFAGVKPDGAPDPALERLRLQRKSVLDAALSQVSALKGTLGANDRGKLDEYLDSFRQVETRVTRMSASGCLPPARPKAFEDEEDPWRSELTPEISAMQLDNLAMAIACDLTRVATFQIGNEGTVSTHPFVGVNIRHHDLSHCDHDAPEAPEQYALIGKIQQWNAKQLAGLIDRLKAIPEGGGTAFDNTIIVWFNGLTYGATHTNERNPVLIAGSGGGYLKTGRHFRLDRKEGATVRTFADLFTTLAPAYGAQIDKFGDAAFNHGPIPGLRG